LVRRVTYLIDSHVLLWWLGPDPRLSKAHDEILRDPRNEILVSAISVAELELKVSIGKLDMPNNLNERIEANSFGTLPFTARHAATLRNLPLHHRDPFDRMLVSQAMTDDLVFLTDDANCRKYDIVTR
jgi:PIN domain nuclease of toxin-antitoxin system